MVLTTPAEKVPSAQNESSLNFQPETLVEGEAPSQKSATVHTQAQEYDLTTTIKPLEGWRLVVVMLT